MTLTSINSTVSNEYSRNSSSCTTDVLATSPIRHEGAWSTTNIKHNAMPKRRDFASLANKGRKWEGRSAHLPKRSQTNSLYMLAIINKNPRVSFPLQLFFCFLFTGSSPFRTVLVTITVYEENGKNKFQTEPRAQYLSLPPVASTNISIKPPSSYTFVINIIYTTNSNPTLIITRPRPPF